MAAGALGVTLFGVVPSAAASADPNADPIIAQALNGPGQRVNYPAAGFTLTSQDGARVSLASLRGQVVVLTFLDPVPTSSGRLIGHELLASGRLLAARTGRVRLVAVVSGQADPAPAALRAFSRQEGLNLVPGWLFLTGTPAQLGSVWDDYGVAAPARSDDPAFVIDRSGRVREIISMHPGPGTPASQSSIAVQLAEAAGQMPAG